MLHEFSAAMTISLSSSDLFHTLELLNKMFGSGFRHCFNLVKRPSHGGPLIEGLRLDQSRFTGMMKL